MSTIGPTEASFIGDPGAEVAALAVEQGGQERTAARGARAADEELQEHEDAESVQAMRDKASSMRTQAWFDAGATVVKAACAQDKTDTELVEAGQKLGDGLFAAGQVNDDANVKAHESAAAGAKFAAQSDTDAIGDATEYIRAALDYYREYASTQAQTAAAAIHRA
jgi:hypothetical protein